MTKNQKTIVLIPILFSCFLSLFIFLLVHVFSSSLTRQAQELLGNEPAQFLTATFFLLIPNLMLSFFLFSYIKAHPQEEKYPLLLCLSSLSIAVLFCFSIWIFYYTAFSQVLVVVFGFPVTYFFGMSIGYVVGVLAIGLKRH